MTIEAELIPKKQSSSGGCLESGACFFAGILCLMWAGSVCFLAWIFHLSGWAAGGQNLLGYSAVAYLVVALSPTVLLGVIGLIQALRKGDPIARLTFIVMGVGMGVLGAAGQYGMHYFWAPPPPKPLTAEQKQLDQLQNTLAKGKERQAGLEKLVEKFAQDRKDLAVKLKESGVYSVSDLSTKKDDPTVQRLTKELSELLADTRKVKSRLADCDDLIGKTESLVRRLERRLAMAQLDPSDGERQEIDQVAETIFELEVRVATESNYTSELDEFQRQTMLQEGLGEVLESAP